MHRLLGVAALFVCYFSFNLVMAMEKTICGQADDRIPSDDAKVGRIIEKNAPAGCTITLIGKACVISAGHCTSTFQIAEFNVPPSRSGRIAHSAEKDVYEADLNSLVYKNNGQGDDFSVFRLKANAITGQYPGEVQGHYKVSFTAPKVGDTVRITGYGADSTQGERNYAQQTHSGPITEISGSLLSHQVDTMGGNSGSSIILESTNEIVGIHTHGGCGTYSGSNASTLISAHSALRTAIQNCLKAEANLP